MSKQNELLKKIDDIVDNHFLNSTSCEEMANEIINLFREKARKTAHECVPISEVFGFWDNCITQTHKNIDDKFDAWGKK